MSSLALGLILGKIAGFAPRGVSGMQASAYAEGIVQANAIASQANGSMTSAQGAGLAANALVSLGVAGAAGFFGAPLLAGVLGGAFLGWLAGLALESIYENWESWRDGENPENPDWHNDTFDNPPISPLVFDLTGDGLNLIDIADSHAFFDLNLDGFAQHTAWIGEGNAFLAYDWNGNGVIDDNSELFGSATVDGFTILAQYDTNGDGVSDAQDEIFGGLLLWQDLNGNGNFDEGELFTLADMGITSINLDATYINQWSGGNWLSHESTFTWANGDTGQIIDVWFENSTLHTRYRPGENLEFADDILILPELSGYGAARRRGAFVKCKATGQFWNADRGRRAGRLGRMLQRPARSTQATGEKYALTHPSISARLCL